MKFHCVQVVEKKLAREAGKTRHDLGRENFVAEVHKWVADYGGRIWNQQKRMGISVDWSRQRFTLDESMSRAVLEAFVRFHEVRTPCLPSTQMPVKHRQRLVRVSASLALSPAATACAQAHNSLPSQFVIVACRRA
jgi:tRNA synthetases class I (I, L, M and V)